MAHDITTDGITVWINSPDGLLGRFGRQGIDVHRPAGEQQEQGECLFCTHQRVTVEDWRQFQAKMLEHFKITVGDQYMPVRFR